ncbi:MAG: AtpZ/AtpI family protein [Asticcacaulis sp.]
MADELPDKSSDQARLQDLDTRLKAIEARKRKTHDVSGELGANNGYQALGELLAGILGGLGLGWLSDEYLHTRPFGVIIGAILGMVVAVYAIVKSGQSSDAGSDPDKD